jgi:hypothetical protein
MSNFLIFLVLNSDKSLIFRHSSPNLLKQSHNGLSPNFNKAALAARNHLVNGSNNKWFTYPRSMTELRSRARKPCPFSHLLPVTPTF